MIQGFVRPLKGLIRIYKKKLRFFMIVLDFYFLLFPRFLPVILVPELFRKLRETPGNNFHLVSSKFLTKESNPMNILNKDKNSKNKQNQGKTTP